MPRKARGWASKDLLRDLCARHREWPAGLAAQHLINEAGRNQLTDPAQPNEARPHKVVTAQAVPGVGSGELVDAVPHGPAQVQIGEGPGQLGEVNTVVAQVRPGAFGERYPRTRHRVADQ